MAFHGRVALVTGGASGMGQLMALRLAQAGARVAIVDLNEAALKETTAMADGISAYPCDVSDLTQVQAMVAEVVQDLGPVDRLAHAAGIMPAGALLDSGPDAVTRPMRVNYFGTVNVTSTVLPEMLERQRGDVIIFGSVAGYAYSTSFGAYGASKAAVNAYAEVLINEYRGSGLRMILAAPPAVKTPLLDQAMGNGPKAFRDSVTKNRLASPESVIDAIEKGLEKGKQIVLPGEARAIYGVRRAAPQLMWKMVNRFNRLNR